MQLGHDPLVDAFLVLHHVIVPKTQNLKPVRLETARSPLFVIARISVLTTVDLNDKPTLERDEIDDVPFDGLLTTKFRADLARAQEMPDPFLRFGPLVAQLAGKVRAHEPTAPSPSHRFATGPFLSREGRSDSPGVRLLIMSSQR